jgi:RNA polymerase sigma factor for flagellar operon FliA
MDQYYSWLGDINFSILSLDQTLVFDNGEVSNLYGSLEDKQMQSPSQQIDDKELKAELIVAIGQLPEREQLMISLYYNDGLTMKEIGEVLEVSESRVSQIHARTMLTLRGLIKSRTEPNPVTYTRRGTHASVFATAS